MKSQGIGDIVRSHRAPILVTLLVLGLSWMIPAGTIDPWQILSLKKIATVIASLALIQVIASLAALYLGPRSSTVFTGFLGGLISSTAFTVALARRTHQSESGREAVHILAFLSATFAMLCEALVLTWVGLSSVSWDVVAPFGAPLVGTGLLMVYFHSVVGPDGPKKRVPDRQEFKVVPLIQLTMFIVVVLGVSKFLQIEFGDRGLLVMTFLVSLFEIHGSVIANVQLYSGHQISEEVFHQLISLSLAASYCSKCLLVIVLGSPAFRKRILVLSLIMLGVLGLQVALQAIVY